MKKLFLLITSTWALALFGFTIHLHLNERKLQGDAFGMQNGGRLFSFDVVAVDAQTGEVIPYAGLVHQEEYPATLKEQIEFPRLSRVLGPEPGHIKVSGVADGPIPMTLCARDYEEANVAIGPFQSGPAAGPLVVKLNPKRSLTTTKTLASESDPIDL